MDVIGNMECFSSKDLVPRTKILLPGLVAAMCPC